jgi:hypothetical protein
MYQLPGFPTKLQGVYPACCGIRGVALAPQLLRVTLHCACIGTSSRRVRVPKVVDIRALPLNFADDAYTRAAGALVAASAARARCGGSRNELPERPSEDRSVAAGAPCSDDASSCRPSGSVSPEEVEECGGGIGSCWVAWLIFGTRRSCCTEGPGDE